jgi:acyl transferase domain-containing protein
MQRAIVTIQKLRGKVEALERSRTEPIAIVGMGCRFPGGANTPEAFFRLLEEGVDAVTEVPPERWRLEQESADSQGEDRALRWGAFLKDVDRFDATFFGISPREAESLDPQQRLLLEVSWEAFERAGQLPERLMGSKTGVFVGIWSLDYQQRVLALSPDKLDAYCFTGNVLSTAAGRLAYTLGLQGPCMTVETACSSSLTAVHLACQSLRMGESSMALAGGVNLMLSPTTTKLLIKTQALSPDGRCKTFDARANGFVRGEGCGLLVLKRLSDAERDGDTILALVRGSAINQDGRSTGLTAPNVLSQQALLRQALENARLTPQDIGYLETHGTGTSLGDPIEAEAIKAVLGAPRDKGATCVLGAVKSNIGHLEGAAGVAGIIKVVLALQNEKIPGNLHFRSLNPRIDLNGTSLEIAQAPKAWVPGIRPRFAGVSAFGISGTNAHVIVEEAPRNLEEALGEEEVSTCLLPISAKTPQAVHDHVRAYRELLGSEQSPRLVDIVYTASSRRAHYVHRLSVVGRTKEEMAAQLDAYLQGNTPSEVAQGQSTPARAKVVFVFSGQGSQWLGMGRDLYQADASFRSVIDTCDNLMTSRLGWSILDELEATEGVSRITETHVAQPLLFALQVALVEMLRAWGISPDAMIGHSVGEIAAAHTAGILSLDEAIRLVSLRGRIMQKTTGTGKMVSIAILPEDAENAIAGYQDRVSIAAINDPGSVVLSGQPAAIDEVVARFEKKGVVCRALGINYAFHSHQMEATERELVERLVRVDTRRATLAMYSTVLADCVDGKELDVRYWGRNVRSTVDFAGAVSAAIRDGYQLFLEIGPHPDLVTSIQKCLAAKNAEGFVVGTLQKKQEDRRAMLMAVGALYTRGCAIEWSRVVPTGGRCVPLPTYPWQRERYWLELSENTVSASKSSLASAAVSTGPRTKVAFVFPGQGSQWLGMGQQLIAEEHVDAVLAFGPEGVRLGKHPLHQGMTGAIKNHDIPLRMPGEFCGQAARELVEFAVQGRIKNFMSLRL